VSSLDRKGRANFSYFLYLAVFQRVSRSVAYLFNILSRRPAKYFRQINGRAARFVVWFCFKTVGNY
jgi:hypothetical protein